LSRPFALLLLLALLLPGPATADGVSDDLIAALMRLPSPDGRRARLVQELSDPSNSTLENEQLGSALSVLGALAADKREDPYIVRLFLIAALHADPEVRNEATLAARRGQGPPTTEDGPGRDEAARFLLERKWLYLRGVDRRLHVVDYEGVRVPLSRFVYKVRDDEIASILERQTRRSWGVFGGLFAGGFGTAVGGGLSLVAASPEAFDGVGGGRAPDPEVARIVGGSLIGIGVSAILAGVVQRAVVAGRHRRAYGRYYTAERLRDVVDRRNRRVADDLGISPEADD